MEYIEILFDDIAQTMKKAGCELTEDQLAILAECLAYYLVDDQE